MAETWNYKIMNEQIENINYIILIKMSSDNDLENGIGIWTRHEMKIFQREQNSPEAVAKNWLNFLNEVPAS